MQLLNVIMDRWTKHLGMAYWIRWLTFIKHRLFIDVKRWQNRRSNPITLIAASQGTPGLTRNQAITTDGQWSSSSLGFNNSFSCQCQTSLNYVNKALISQYLTYPIGIVCRHLSTCFHWTLRHPQKANTCGCLNIVCPDIANESNLYIWLLVFFLQMIWRAKLALIEKLTVYIY